MMNNDYKEQCWKRYLENQKYEKYDKEDLVDEIIELQKENQQLKHNIDDGIEFMNTVTIVNNINEWLNRLESILKGDSDE